MNLHLKYRPRRFSEVVGNGIVVKAIRNSVVRGKLPNSLIFTGESGCGKTTLARIVAKSINCLNPLEGGDPCNECHNCKTLESSLNYSEIDAASNNGVDNIRDLISDVHYPPQKPFKQRVVVLDEAHGLSNSAQQAFLKTLEDAPRHLTFILCTTDPKKLLKTIRTRCTTYEVSCTGLNSLLERVITEEGLDLPESLYGAIIANSGRSYRGLLTLLNSIISIDDPTIEDISELLGEPSPSDINFWVNLTTQGLAKQSITFFKKLLDSGFTTDKLIEHFTRTLKDNWLSRVNADPTPLFNYFQRLGTLSKLDEKNKESYFEVLLATFVLPNPMISSSSSNPNIQAVPSKEPWGLDKLDDITREGLKKYVVTLSEDKVVSSKKIPHRLQKKIIDLVYEGVQIPFIIE